MTVRCSLRSQRLHRPDPHRGIEVATVKQIFEFRRVARDDTGVERQGVELEVETDRRAGLLVTIS